MNNQYLIRIILRARDEVSGVLRQIRQEVNDFNRDMNNGGRDTDAMRDAMNALRESVDSLRNRLGRAGEALDAVRNQTRQSRDDIDSFSTEVDLATESVSNNAEAVDRLSESHENASRSTKKHEEAKKSALQRAEELRVSLGSLRGEVNNSDRDLNDLSFSVGRIADEFRKLARSADVVNDTNLAETFNRDARAAKAFQQQLESTVQTNRERGPLLDDEKEAQSRAKVLAYLNEFRAAVDDMYEEREKNERALADFEIKEIARVEAERAAFRLKREAAEAKEAARQAKIELDANTDPAERKIDALVARLARLARQRVVAQTDAETINAERKIALLQAELMELGMTRVEVDVRVDEELNRARTMMRDLNSEVSSSLGFWDAFERRMQSNSLHVNALSSALRGMAIFAAITFAQQLLSVVTSLGASLIAVASSAAMAGASLGGAFAAGAAQAVPAIGLLVAAMARVAAVQDAVQQYDLVQQQQASQREQRDRRQAGAADQLANAQDGLQNALEGVGAAQRRVADAQRNYIAAQRAEFNAQRDLTQARRDARRELEDMILAARGAALGQEEAENALRRAIASGQTADIASRELDLDEARLRNSRAQADTSTAVRGGVNRMPEVEQATENLTRARQQVEDARRGIADAERGVVQAQRAVDRARRGIEQARRQAAGAGEDQLASVGKLDYMLSQLSESEQRLYRAMIRLRETYNQNIRPITDEIIDSFSRALDSVDELLKNADFLDGLSGLSGAIAGEIDAGMEELTGDRAMRQYLLFLREGTDNTQVLGETMRNAFGIALDVAEAASPALRVILDYVRDLSNEWRTWTSSTEGQESMRNFFIEGAEHLKSWMGLLGATIQLFGALMGESADSGKTIVEDLTVKVQEATRWIETHQTEVRRFFEDARKATYEVAEVVWELGKAIIEAFDPESVEALSDFLKIVVIPTLVNLIEWLGRVTNILMEIASNPVVAFFIRLAAELFILRRIINVIVTLIFAMRTGVRGLLADILLLRGGVVSAGATMGALTGTLGGLRAAFLALAGGKGIGAAIDAFKRYRSEARNARGASAGRSGAGAAGGLDFLDVAEDGEGRNRRGAATPDGPSRGQRVARGAGIAVAVGGGAYALSQGQSGMRDYANQGEWSQAMDNVSGSIQKLFSLDVGGFFRSLSGWSDDAQKDLKGFASTADNSFKRAVSRRNEQGLRDMAKQAREMAEKFPLAAESLNKFADGADQAADRVRDLNNRLRPLGQLRDTFLKQGLRAEDLIDPNAATQVLRNFDRIRRDGVLSVRDLRDNLTFNIKQINRAFAEGTPSWRKAMEDNFGAGIRAVRVSMRNGTISVKDGMKEIRSITRDQMKYVRDNMSTLSDEGKERISKNFSDAAEAIKIQMNRNKAYTREGMREIRRLMRENMKLYGFTDEQARMHEKGIDPVGGKPYNTMGGKAGGGFLGMPGERGDDGTAGTVMGHPVGRGEAVVFNSDQQGIINNALQAQYGFNLPQMFDRYKSMHGKESAGGFARGGRIVGVPGFPGERAASYILDEIAEVVRRFGLRLTDAYGQGHKSPGHTQRGDAADFAGPDRSMDRAVRWLTGKGYVVGYDGRFGSKAWPGHGPTSAAGSNAHLHVEFGQKDIGGAAGEPMVGGDVPRIKRVRIKGINTESPLGAIAQRVVDRTRSAANERLAQAAQESGIAAESMEAKASAGRLSAAEVQNIINRAMIVTRVPMQLRSAWRSMALRRARQESGFDPNIQNNWDVNAKNGDPSRGLFQTIGATFRAYMLPGMSNILNPLHNTVAAFRYMFARYGSGESWPQALRAMLGREGAGYRFGGAVPGFGGGDQHNAKLEGGEHVLTKEEVRAAGGHGAIYALRKMLGGGAQAVGRKLRQGGAYVGHTPRQVIGNITDINNYRDTTPAGILAQIQQLRQYMRRLSTTGKNYAFALRELARMSESLTDAATRTAARARAQLARSRFSMSRDGVVTIRGGAGPEGERARADGDARLDAQERRRISRRADVQRGELADVERRMRGQRGGLMSESEEDTLRKRLAELEKGGVKGDERAQVKSINRRLETGGRRNNAYNRLVSERNRLLDGIAEADEAVASSLEAQYNRQREEVERLTTAANEGAQRRNARLDFRERMATILGQADQIPGIVSERIGSMNAQIADLGRAQAEASRTGNNDLVQSIGDQIVELQESIQEAVAQQLQTSFDNWNQAAQRRQASYDRRGRVAELFGQVGTLGGLIDERAQNARNEINELLSFLGQAQAQGNVGLANTIREQIADLEVSIQEFTVQRFESGIEQINSAAQRRMGRLDIAGRMLDALGVVGRQGARMVGGEAFSREGIFAQRGATLANQRNALANQLGRAVQIYGENSSKVQDLRDQIVELDVTIQENTRAAFMSRVEDANERAGYDTSMLDIRSRIIQTQGEISGDVDENALVSLSQQRGTALQTQRGELQVLLDEARRNGDERAIKDLEKALLENELAILENTKATLELNGNLGENTQTFTSSAWQIFRQAIFDGSGGLLPQYAAATPTVNGGNMVSDGALFGRDMSIQTTPQTIESATRGGDHIDIDIHAVDGKVDTSSLVRRIMFEKSSAR